ncbi:Hypothetical protein, putative [Bodo saltans]|uniref:MATH domain-containing protein n=1 Tax=Bodo saltans TaxID=75058 RepID=A0A0S4JMK9_BODSA|nr:Hypothetical protein, putative [Bodo saltans]|eukprot:CUG91455.1 Hypothetical protein, putative [Bodo saltans]
MFAPPKSTAVSHADKFHALQVFPARTAPISQDVFTLTTPIPQPSGHDTTKANLTPSSLCEWGATFKSRPAHRYTAQRFEVLLNLALLQDAELVVKLQRVVANGNVKRGGGGGGGNRRAASLLSSKGAVASMDPKTRWMWLFASIWEHALTELKQRMERSDQQNNTQHTIQIYPVILKLQAHISKLTSSPQEMHKNVTAGCTVTPYDPFSCFLWTFVQATPQQQPCECGSLNHSPVVIAVRAMCALFSIPLMPVLLANNVNPTLPMTAAVLKAHISPLLADALFLAGLEHLLSHVPSTLLSQLLPSSSSSSTHTSAPGDKESASAAILNMRELFVKSLRGGELWNFDCAFSTPISSTAISPPGPVGYVIPSSTNAASPVTGVFSFHVHNIAQVLLDPTRLFYGPRFEFHGLHWYLLLSSENDVEKEDSAGKSAPPDIGVYLCVEEGNVGCTFRVDLVNECRDDSVTVEASHQFPKTYCGKGWGRGLCTAKQTLCPALGFIVATTDHQNGAPQPSPWFTQHWPSNAAAQWTALHTVTLEVQISVHPHDNYSVPPPPPPSSQKATLTSSAALSAPRLASQEQLQHGGAPMHEQLAKELVDEEDAKIRAKNFAAKFQNLLKLEDQQRRAIQHGRKNDKTSLFVECAHALAAVRQQVDERAQESASIVSHYHHLHHYDQHNTSVDVAEGLSLHQQSSAVLPPAVTSTSSGEPIHNSDDKVFRSETLHRMNVLHRDCQTLHQSTIMISAEVDELVVERRRLATRLSRSEDLIAATAATQRAVDRQAVMIAELRKRMDRLSKRDKRIERPSREMLSSTNDDDSGSDDDDGSSSKRSLGEHHNTLDAAYTKPPPSRGGDGGIRSLPSDAFTTQVIGKPIGGGGATQQCGCERAAFLNLEDWLGMHLSTCSQHNNSHCADKW